MTTLATFPTASLQNILFTSHRVALFLDLLVLTPDPVARESLLGLHLDSMRDGCRVIVDEISTVIGHDLEGGES